MGISHDGARFLASRHDVDFIDTVTLGRQQLFLGAEDLEAIGVDAGTASALVPDDLWAEPFLRHLGARAVESLDASTFEGATIPHDLNEPLPADLADRFSVVIDGGTLEHVFDYPTALANAMRLARVGGHLLLITPANNQMGHGFYQFSPELFFRVLVPENGYVIEQVLLKTSLRRSPWWQVVDPVQSGGRAEMLTSRVTYMYVQARRTGDVGEKLTVPQQSDYVAVWAGELKSRPASRRRALAEAVTSRLGPLKRLSHRIDPAMGVIGWSRRVPDRRYFQPIALPGLAPGHVR